MPTHTHSVAVKMHEQMFAHIKRQAKATYRTNQEYIRQLIVDDMEKVNGQTHTTEHVTRHPVTTPGETGSEVLR